MLEFKLLYKGKEVQAQQRFALSTSDDSVQLSDLRFYISEAQFLSASGDKTPFSRHHYLCDFQQPASLHITAPSQPKANGGEDVFFQIGIDSTTNSAGALGQDLDPVHGMYWTWNSGYINVKIQGTSASCPARNHQFEFHLGGYQFPNNALCEFKQRITNKDTLVIGVELSRFFAAIDLKKEYQIMSPSKRAVELSKLFAQCFYLMP
ncbi:MAG: hypothetical protein RLZZ543_1257 [Bacteroidota bacterium]|jgi:hypothetical protein